jgi:cytochrome c6
LKILFFLSGFFFFLSEKLIDPSTQFTLFLPSLEKNTLVEKRILTTLEDSRNSIGKEATERKLSWDKEGSSNFQAKNISNSLPEYGLGKEIFRTHCIACHNQGKNLIIPEKNLKKEALEANGMNNLNAISYQVINGKNGMPAFGGRLLEEEIEAVSIYVLKQSSLNFKE